MSGKMIIDNIPVEFTDEKNILAVCRKAGIDLPTFCYYPELSTFGACRMCVFENDRGAMEASCSTPPKDGMVIYTNTPNLQKYRRNILKLLLANHCRDCTTCEKSNDCKLQALAKRFNITDVPFPNTNTVPQKDTSSVSIELDNSKCILCGSCVRTCREIQNVGAIDFAHRGSHARISTAFGKPLSETNCVGCGQCAAVCPTAALVVKNDTSKLWADMADKDATVIVQIAPAVRVGVAKDLGIQDGTLAMGKIVSSLKRMGVDKVFDTSTSADLTVLEEGAEFLERIQNGGPLPLFTSCCPAWIRYAEKKHPELLANISTCRSPMQMFSPVIKEFYSKENEGKRIVSVAVMPCTAKKFEATRKEFVDENGVPCTDYVISTQELIKMITEAGIDFQTIEPTSVDVPFGAYTGAGVIFGVTGGVTEAVLRKLYADINMAELKTIAMNTVRGLEGVKEATLKFGDMDVNIAVVSGLANAEKLIQKIQSGEANYHFVEVMACPGGCIAGGGQPPAALAEKLVRSDALYATDTLCQFRRADDNPLMKVIYDDIVKGRQHEMLHVHYGEH